MFRLNTTSRRGDFRFSGWVLVIALIATQSTAANSDQLAGPILFGPGQNVAAESSGANSQRPEASPLLESAIDVGTGKYEPGTYLRRRKTEDNDKSAASRLDQNSTVPSRTSGIVLALSKQPENGDIENPFRSPPPTESTPTPELQRLAVDVRAEGITAKGDTTLHLMSADGSALPTIEFAEHQQTTQLAKASAVGNEFSKNGRPVKNQPVASVSRLAQLMAPNQSDKKSSSDGQSRAVAGWSPKPLHRLGIGIAPPGGKLPQQETAVHSGEPVVVQGIGPRPWAQLTYQFAATCSVHNPLYFEEVNLERYGYGCGYCLQPAASAAHFFTRVPMLPYLMAHDCPSECEYTLGHYRPGDCAPWRQHCEGWSYRGGLSEAGALVGLILLFP